MNISASRLQTWGRCPESYRLKYSVAVPGRLNGSTSFGTVMHYALQIYWLNGKDLDIAKQTFEYYWNHPEYLDAQPDFFLPRTSWSGFLAHGLQSLNYYHEAQTTWQADHKVIGVEVPFELPIGDGHSIRGFIDLLRLVPTGNGWSLDVADYKTGKTQKFLRYHVQFTIYVWATYQAAFWANVENGQDWLAYVADKPRTGTWVDFKSSPFKELDVGERAEGDFHRLEKTCNAFAKSVSEEIFVPTLSGDTCAYCDFWEECGLPDGNLISQPVEEIDDRKSSFSW